MKQKDQPRKRIVVQIELDQIDLTKKEEDQRERDFVMWIEGFPGHRDRNSELADITVVFPCARCGFAGTCKRVFGEDCHT